MLFELIVCITIFLFGYYIGSVLEGYKLIREDDEIEQKLQFYQNLVVKQNEFYMSILNKSEIQYVFAEERDFDWTDEFKELES